MSRQRSTVELPWLSCGYRIRTDDFQVMSLARYRCVNPRRGLSVASPANMGQHLFDPEINLAMLTDQVDKLFSAINSGIGEPT